VARVFVRLKLRLLRNRLSTGGFLSGVGFVVVWLAALAGGLGGGLVLGVLSRAAEDLIGAVTVLVFTGTGLAWMIVPVILASLDDALEARSFELLPLSSRDLARGLLVAALVGPGTLATVLGLGYGSLLAFGSAATFVPILLATVVMIMLCVGVARWATTRLSDLLRQRRGQEIAVLVVVAFTTIPAMLSLSLAEVEEATASDVTAVFDAMAGVAQFTPWGAVGRAVVASAAGDWLFAAGALAYGAGVAWVSLMLFGRALRRLAVTVPAAGRSGRTASRLLPKRIPLPPTPVGAVAARELIAVRRDVRVRGQLLGGIVAVLVLGVVGGMALIGTPYAPFFAVVAVFIVVTAVTPNQFGYDGGSFWGYLTMAPDLGTVIKGKNLGWAVVALPIAVVASVAGGAASRDWSYVLAALLGSVAIALIWLGVGNITSIYGAYPLPETNLFGSRNLSGGAFVATMLGIMASGFLTLPPALAVGVPVFLGSPLWATAGSIAGVAYAVFIYRIAVVQSGRLAHDRRFALLATLDGD
jgi:ABC-2 type transport system permease protein